MNMTIFQGLVLRFMIIVLRYICINLYRNSLAESKVTKEAKKFTKVLEGWIERDGELPDDLDFYGEK